MSNAFSKKLPLPIDIVKVGYSEETDIVLFNRIFTSNFFMEVRHDLPINWCETYEAAVSIIENDGEFFHHKLIIIGAYVQSKESDIPLQKRRAEASFSFYWCIDDKAVLRQNSEKLANLCQIKKLQYIVVDTEKSPDWAKNLKKIKKLE